MPDKPAEMDLAREPATPKPRDALGRLVSEDSATRFFRLVVPAAWGCLLWSGAVMPRGYASFRHQGRSVLAHRWAWEHYYGKPIPDGMEIDHLCFFKLCVNPVHLEAVTPLENKLRWLATYRPNARPFSEEDRRNILERFRNGEYKADIAKDMRVHSSRISEVVNGRRRSKIPPVRRRVECWDG